MNLCIERNLSKRELIQEIKSNSYERLINKPDHIEIMNPKKEYTILNDMKNPILIKVDKNQIIKSEKDLETTILSQLSFFFSQLGEGYSFIETEFEIKGKRIDMLLFNYLYNSFVVVELK